MLKAQRISVQFKARMVGAGQSCWVTARPVSCSMVAALPSSFLLTYTYCSLNCPLVNIWGMTQ